MARPIEPTPTLEGEDARRFIENANRVARGEITPEEKARSLKELRHGISFTLRSASGTMPVRQ